jgi:hypothetical protein
MGSPFSIHSHFFLGFFQAFPYKFPKKERNVSGDLYDDDETYDCKIEWRHFEEEAPKQYETVMTCVDMTWYFVHMFEDRIEFFSDEGRYLKFERNDEHEYYIDGTLVELWIQLPEPP